MDWIGVSLILAALALSVVGYVDAMYRTITASGVSDLAIIVVAAAISAFFIIWLFSVWLGLRAFWNVAGRRQLGRHLCSTCVFTLCAGAVAVGVLEAGSTDSKSFHPWEMVLCCVMFLLLGALAAYESWLVCVKRLNDVPRRRPREFDTPSPSYYSDDGTVPTDDGGGTDAGDESGDCSKS
eukprot:c2150_g1_i1.p1 GENE.c2150_g1_i1~~c2150_g1_i1.p1  ORF type:complete len:181 (+),score=31.70 c2150_g1_i1:196-738(+)